MPRRHLLIRLLPCLMLAPLGIVDGCHLVPFLGFGSVSPVIQCTMYGVYSVSCVSSTSPTFVPFNALHLYSVSSTSPTAVPFTTITCMLSSITLDLHYLRRRAFHLALLVGVRGRCHTPSAAVPHLLGSRRILFGSSPLASDFFGVCFVLAIIIRAE